MISCNVIPVFYKNNNITPAIDTTAPRISLGVTFSLNIYMEAGMTNMGDIDEIDETIPVAVYLTAKRENATPTKGPKIEPATNAGMALLFFIDSNISGHFLFLVINKVNTRAAAMILICVAARGS